MVSDKTYQIVRQRFADLMVGNQIKQIITISNEFDPHWVVNTWGVILRSFHNYCRHSHTFFNFYKNRY